MDTTTGTRPNLSYDDLKTNVMRPGNWMALFGSFNFQSNNAMNVPAVLSEARFFRNDDISTLPKFLRVTEFNEQ